MNNLFEKLIGVSAPDIKSDPAKKEAHWVKLDERLNNRQQRQDYKKQKQLRAGLVAVVALFTLGGLSFAGMNSDWFEFQIRSSSYLPEDHMMVRIPAWDFNMNISKDIPVDELIDLATRLHDWTDDPVAMYSIQAQGAEIWCVGKDIEDSEGIKRWWRNSDSHHNVNGETLIDLLAGDFDVALGEIESGQMQPIGSRQVEVDGVMFQASVYEFVSPEFGKVTYLKGLPTR